MKKLIIAITLLISFNIQAKALPIILMFDLIETSASEKFQDTNELKKLLQKTTQPNLSVATSLIDNNLSMRQCIKMAMDMVRDDAKILLKDERGQSTIKSSTNVLENSDEFSIKLIDLIDINNRIQNITLVDYVCID